MSSGTSRRAGWAEASWLNSDGSSDGRDREEDALRDLEANAHQLIDRCEAFLRRAKNTRRPRLLPVRHSSDVQSPSLSTPETALITTLREDVPGLGAAQKRL
ncbi:unnamed protein product [Diplocarpon coronariae]|uniref:DNA polymerase III subunit alpha n=1 Tax=Diplocarpon coronariae TaxID=2795749 RepID=A0A218YVU6_9HELO|nr:hypothetical protein JHW43_008748 [Diplocarpon mali]OWO99916.1 DNA polymerase III subunit alpha [Marssonina coronariae]